MWFAVVKKTRTNTRFLLKASRIAVGSKVFQNGCLVRLETTVPSLLFRFDFGRADETELEIEIDYDFALLRYHLADDAAEQQQYKSFFAFAATPQATETIQTIFKNYDPESEQPNDRYLISGRSFFN